jgi:hypothetical protein
VFQKNYMTGSLILIAGLFLVSALPGQQNQQKMMEAYMKMATPNENHAYLKNFVGEWNVTTQGWTTPGAPPQTSQGTGEAELLLGGRFVQMEYKGTMFGQPFEGLQILGYDNLKKKYVSFWLDNTSTAFYLTEGTRDPATKTVTETGLWPDFMTGGNVKVRATTKWLSPDEFVYEMFMTGADSKEFKSVENHAIRKK